MSKLCPLKGWVFSPGDDPRPRVKAIGGCRQGRTALSPRAQAPAARTPRPHPRAPYLLSREGTSSPAPLVPHNPLPPPLGRVRATPTSYRTGVIVPHTPCASSLSLSLTGLPPYPLAHLLPHRLSQRGQPLLLVHPTTPLPSTDCPGRVPGAHPPPPDVPPTRYLRSLLGGGYPPLLAPLGGVLRSAPPPPSPLQSFTKKTIPPTSSPTRRVPTPLSALVAGCPPPHIEVRLASLPNPKSH